MSIVAAVKEAMRYGADDHWMLYLPKEEKQSYFASRSSREFGSEFMDFVMMQCAESILKEHGIRGG